MAPEGCSIAVVEVGRRAVEFLLKCQADVVSGPRTMYKIGRAALAQYASGTGWPRRIEANSDNVCQPHASTVSRNS